MTNYLYYVDLQSSLRGIRHAFLQSLMAVIVLVIVAGAAFLPAEVNRANVPDVSAIASYDTGDKGRLGVMLVRTLSLEHVRGTRHRLIVHDFQRNSLREVNSPFPARPLCLATSMKDARLFVGDDSGTVYFLDLRRPGSSGYVIGRHIQGVPSQLACSADAQTLLSVDAQGIYAWDLQALELRWWRSRLAVNCLAFLPDCRTMICQEAGAFKKQILEIDLQSGETLRVIGSANCALDVLTTNSAGTLLAGIGWGGSLLLWQRDPGGTTWREKAVPQIHGGPARNTASFLPHSDLLAIGDTDGQRIAVWNIQDGTRVSQIGRPETLALGAEFVDGDTLLTWNANGTLAWWRWREGILVRSKSMPPLLQPS